MFACCCGCCLVVFYNRRRKKPPVFLVDDEFIFHKNPLFTHPSPTRVAGALDSMEDGDDDDGNGSIFHENPLFAHPTPLLEVGPEVV